MRYRLGVNDIETCWDHASTWESDSTTLGSPPSAWSLYVEPNPHPEGSYMWAYEETQRGRQVKRECGRCWPTDRLLEHDDFIATDWVLC
jgi:hypothetical protein